MSDMQTSFALLIVRPSILNPIINFSTHLWLVKWECPRLYLCLAHSILSPPTHAPTNHQMIWSTSYHHMTVLVHRSWPHLLLTVASVHRCQVLLKLHRHTWFLVSKPLTCPSLLQPVHQAKPHLDLLQVTWLHVMSHMQWAHPSSHNHLWTNLLSISHTHY